MRGYGISRHLERRRGARSDRLPALADARAHHRARDDQGLPGIARLPRDEGRHQPLLHPVRAGSTRGPRRRGLSGAPQRADAVVAAHHAEARQFHAGRRHHGRAGRAGRGGHDHGAADRDAARQIPQKLAEALVACDGVAAVQIGATDEARTSVPTTEKGMRKDEGFFAGLLLIEALDLTSLQAALQQAARRLRLTSSAGASEPEVYQTMFTLDARIADFG